MSSLLIWDARQPHPGFAILCIPPGGHESGDVNDRIRNYVRLCQTIGGVGKSRGAKALCVPLPSGPSRAERQVLAERIGSSSASAWYTLQQVIDRCAQTGTRAAQMNWLTIVAQATPTIANSTETALPAGASTAPRGRTQRGHAPVPAPAQAGVGLIAAEGFPRLRTRGR